MTTIGQSIDSTKDGQFIKMRDPKAFFDFDSIDYQYVGVVRCRKDTALSPLFSHAFINLKKHVGQIETDVWVGIKQFSELEGEESMHQEKLTFLKSL